MHDRSIKRLLDHFVIEFSYNGDLGRLQHQTKANYQFINDLAMSEIITQEQHKEFIEKINAYYFSELQKEINRGYIY